MGAIPAFLCHGDPVLVIAQRFQILHIRVPIVIVGRIPDACAKFGTSLLEISGDVAVGLGICLVIFLGAFHKGDDLLRLLAIEIILDLLLQAKIQGRLPAAVGRVNGILPITLGADADTAAVPQGIIHLIEHVGVDHVDAGLAASVFHFGEIKIPELKEYLIGEGINVRR